MGSELLVERRGAWWANVWAGILSVPFPFSNSSILLLFALVPSFSIPLFFRLGLETRFDKADEAEAGCNKSGALDDSIFGPSKLLFLCTDFFVEINGALRLMRTTRLCDDWLDRMGVCIRCDEGTP